MFRIDDRELRRIEPQTEVLDAAFDRAGATDQDRLRELFIDEDLRRTQYPFLLAFREHDSGMLHRCLAGGGIDRLHDRARLMHELPQLLAIGVEIRDGASCNARLHCGFGHRRCDVHDEARIEGFGDQVLGTERQILITVGTCQYFALAHARQIRDGAHRGDFHRPGNRR